MENTSLFKEDIGRIRGSLERSWRRFARVVGAVQLGEDVASIPRRFWLDLAVHQPQISFKFCHNRATIGPRSCVDRDPGARSAIVWSCGIDSAMKAVRSRLDRGSIGPRSWGSSTNPLSRLIALQVTGWSRSRDHVDPDCEERPPSDGGRLRWWSWSWCNPFDEDSTL